MSDDLIKQFSQDYNGTLESLLSVTDKILNMNSEVVIKGQYNQFHKEVLYQCTITHSIGVEIHENWSTAKERKTFHSPTSEDRFSAIKYAVVEFIKWHNTNKE